MKKRAVAVATVVSYNFRTKETISKEFLESEKSRNPINEAEEYKDKKVNYLYPEEDGWQHKIFANKKADQLRKKVWGNLDMR